MIRAVYSMDPGSDILKICDKTGEILVNTANALLKTAYNETTAYGDTAKQLLGKLPPDFRLIKPIREGNFCDFDVMVQLLHLLFFKDKSKAGLFKPDFIVNTSINATVVEQEALCEAIIEAGASKCYLVDSPIAATIGAGVDVAESKGNMIVIVGSEHTEVAILSLSNLVFSATPDFSLRSLMRLTSQYMCDAHEIMLGENTVEFMVKETLNQVNANERKLGPIVGIDKKNGLPKKMQITVKEIWDLILRQLQFLVDSLRESMEGIPPELIKDIMERGILFAGGLANYQGFVNYMKQAMEINLIVPKEPEYLCVRGNMVIHKNKTLHPLIREVF
ncbi:MAG TPA: rod shape-determining protein [Thermotogota bacterium]|nr:rod shape-determining protein [Thermotogota bacterium]HRW35400.1 rod shape-determining protein [Thermotogota bacterium]